MAVKSVLSIPHRICAAWRLVWLGALAAGCLAAAVAAEAQDLKQAVESALAGDQIQRDRPHADRARETADGGQPQPESPQSPGESRPAAPVPAPAAMPMNLSWLPYAILAVIGIGLAVLLLRYAGIRFAARKGAEAKPAPAAASRVLAEPAEPEHDRTFDEVDALAQAGAFTEAVHRLLLLVQERLRGRIEQGFQASLTSREILRRARLPQEASTDFGTLVAAVELSLFGMRAANAQTYALCRENSRRVLRAAAE